MDLKLEGKVALITGASAGIGRATAKLLAEEGVTPILTARRKDVLDELADEIASGTSVKPVVIDGDVTSLDGSADVVKRVFDQFDHIDILVNNLGQARPFGMDNSDDEWEEAFMLNFTSARKLGEAFVPGMRENKFGRVICLTSTLEPFGMSGSHTSKAALLVWAKGLSRMVAKDDVTVNCITPGILMTDQIRNHFIPNVLPGENDQTEFLEKEVPAAHFGEPEDAAQLIAFLSSPKAHYITGQRICVDGGWNRHV